jgi:hypothetical protein
MLRTASVVLQWLVRLTGLVQLALGALFWTANALALVPLHMFVGLVLVLGLWGQAALAARAGLPVGQVALAVVWGAVVPALGMTQAQILPGELHWVVQVVHLLVGIGAIGQAEALARGIRARQAPSVRPGVPQADPV